MKIVLTRFPELQVDCDGRGLVLTYDQQDEEIRVVDKRNAAGVFCYATPQWPFDDPTGDVGPLCPGSNMVTYMVASRLELGDANRPPISSTARPRRTVLGLALSERFRQGPSGYFSPALSSGGLGF